MSLEHRRLSGPTAAIECPFSPSASAHWRKEKKFVCLHWAAVVAFVSSSCRVLEFSPAQLNNNNKTSRHPVEQHKSSRPIQEPLTLQFQLGKLGARMRQANTDGPITHCSNLSLTDCVTLADGTPKEFSPPAWIVSANNG